MEEAQTIGISPLVWGFLSFHFILAFIEILRLPGPNPCSLDLRSEILLSSHSRHLNGDSGDRVGSWGGGGEFYSVGPNLCLPGSGV